MPALAGASFHHDVLPYDPVFKLLAGRSPEGQELASQPTLSRFENAISIPSPRRLQDVLIDQFIASFSASPLHLTFDNAVLKRRSDELLQEAVRRHEETHQPQRLFTAFWYQAGSWPKERWTVIKAEAHDQGTIGRHRTVAPPRQ